MTFSTAISRPLQLVARALQWSSAVIVMGLTSYFIKVGPKGQHLIYQEVIVRTFPLLLGFEMPPRKKSKSNTTALGRPFRCLLPARLHLALLAHCAEQVRPDDRRGLLVPVCAHPDPSIFLSVKPIRSWSMLTPQ